MVTADAVPSPGAASDVGDRSGRLTGLAPGQVLWAMWAMVGVQLVVRTYASASGFLYWDDFILQSRASRLPLASAELLLTDHDGHLMPGAMAVAWLVVHTAPLSAWGVTVSLVVMQALASSAVVLMLRRVFGARPLVLVPLAVYLFAPLTLPSFLWWSAALNALPLQAALACAVWAQVGYLRTGRRSQAGLALAAVVVALAFFEKSVLIPVALLGVTWVLEPGHGYLGPLLSAVRRHWRLWVAYLGVEVAYLLAFSGLVDRGSRVASFTDMWSLVTHGLFQSVIPAAWGGPVRWVPTGFASAIAAPPGWLVWSSSLATAVLVAWSCWARPLSRRAWSVLLVYLVADLAAIAVGRGGTPFTALLPLSLRYTADAGVVLALALGFALMAPAGSAEPARVDAARSWLRRQPSLLRTSAFVAADVFVLLVIVSTAGLTTTWRGNPARPWVENAERTLAAAPKGLPILPQPVPEAVLYGLAYPENLTSSVLHPVLGGHRFGSSTTSLTTFDGFGQLVPGEVVGAESVSRQGERCWAVEGGHGEIQLDQPLAPWEYTVHLAYTAQEAGAGTVRLGAGSPAVVAFQAGRGDVYVRVTGGGSALYLTLDTDDAAVCVDHAETGDVVPLGWAAP